VGVVRPQHGESSRKGAGIQDRAPI
jgi:hypothetical protein